jgi:hypothetical protein
VGPHKSNPLEELKALDQAVDQSNDLNGLRPIFYRLDEIAQKYADDVDVQVAVGDVKQHILNRGNLLTERKKAGQAQEGLSGHPAPPLQDETPTADRTRILPVPQVSPKSGDASTARPPVLPKPDPVIMPPRIITSEKAGGGRSMGFIIAAIVILLGVAIGVVIWRNRTPQVAMRIVTVPPGASIRVIGQAKDETKCTSDCGLSLPPGTYQIAAALDGYEPGAETVTVAANQPALLSLNLHPEPQRVRIHADLAQGRVIFDNMLPAALKNGEYTIEKVMPGRHTVKVMGTGGETSFIFDATPAKQPGITGTVVARDVLTVLVASFANRARVVTSSGPWKLAVNGHAENDAGPAGVDVENMSPGDDELVIGEGDSQRSFKEHFGPEAELTVMVTADPNAGTLVISTGESGVRVFVNNSEYPQRTRQGELRIQASGRVEVRAQKDGFDEPGPQIVDVKKGTTTRLDFKMVPAAH